MNDPAHLLIVDDLEDNRQVLGRRLARAGFAISEAIDGEAALAMTAGQSFDLVLLDWMMPGLAGIEVLARLRAAPATARLPVIIVTARAASRDVVEALDAGADDYVTKPIDFPVVLARVRTQLARKRAEDALHALNAELEQRVAARTEGLRQALAAAESASRARSAFLSAASHELRTPLNAVIGFSELIGTDDGASPTHRQYARDIHASGLRLLEMVDDILTVSRSEAQMTGAAVPVDVCTLVRRCADMMARAAKERQLSLEWTTPETIPAVLADEPALAQALRALLSNALKFNRPGGRVSVEARHEAAGLCLEVADTGVGMASEAIPNLLRPFAQVDQSLARSHEGLGLGLSVARLIAEAHGGQLKLASELGVGTRVAIVLPPERLLPRDVAIASEPAAIPA
jgi:signal transduction histidine kinase